MGSGASSASGRRWHSAARGSGASSALSFSEGRNGHLDVVQLRQRIDDRIVRQRIENKVDDAARVADTSSEERACKQHPGDVLIENFALFVHEAGHGVGRSVSEEVLEFGRAKDTSVRYSTLMEALIDALIPSRDVGDVPQGLSLEVFHASFN